MSRLEHHPFRTLIRNQAAIILASIFVAMGMSLQAAAQQTAPGLAASQRATIEKELVESQALEPLQNYWRLSLREPGDAVASMRSQMGGADPAASWRKAVDQVFSGNRMATMIARHQAEQLTEKEARDVIAFRRSDVGRKVTAAESNPPVPEAKLADQKFLMNEIQKAGKALDRDKPRKRLIADLLQAAGGGAMQAELMMTMSRGFALGMALAVPQGGPRISEQEISALVEKDRPKMMALVRQIAVPSLALAYQRLTNAELKTYLDQLRSPVGSKNIAAVIKAVAIALNETSTEIGHTFAKDIGAQRL